MTNRPICPGTGRAIPGHYPVSGVAAQAPTREYADCPMCGINLELEHGLIPKHRQRLCQFPGCRNTQAAGGLCARHDRELTGKATCLVPGCTNPRLGVCAEHHDEAVS